MSVVYDYVRGKVKAFKSHVACLSPYPVCGSGECGSDVRATHAKPSVRHIWYWIMRSLWRNQLFPSKVQVTMRSCIRREEVALKGIRFLYPPRGRKERNRTNCTVLNKYVTVVLLQNWSISRFLSHLFLLNLLHNYHTVLQTLSELSD